MPRMKPWAYFPTPHKLGMVTHIFSTSIWEAEVGGADISWVILHCLGIFRPAWDTSDPGLVSAKHSQYQEALLVSSELPL